MRTRGRSLKWQIVLCIIGVLISFWIAININAQEKFEDLKLRIDKVSLFKNGLGFVSSSAMLPGQTRVLRMGQLPVPCYGAFWIGYSSQVSLRTAVTSMETVETQTGIQNLGQYLLLNSGRKAVIQTASGERIEGTILPSQSNYEPAEAASPYVMDFRRSSEPYPRYDLQPQAGVLFVKTEKGTVALNSSSISRVEFDGNGTINSASVKRRRPSLRIELERPAGGQRLEVSYLARGITWAPSYLIDLSDPKTAKVSASSVIINELADFENVQLELVTGFPNTKFGDVLAPTAMSQNLADFLNSLARGTTEGRARGSSDLLQQRAVTVNVAAYEESTPLPGYSTAEEGTTSEDLFMYPVKDFSLRKGENAWLPLFTARMPYQHIYTWKIPDFLDAEERRQSMPQNAGDAKGMEEVWHSCRLTNSLKMPLTTAAAEFVNDGRFVGQDVCYYTAPGAETTIRINRAMNVLAEQSEQELERKRNAAQFYNWSYDLVKVKGELKIRSRLDRAAAVEITKELSGEILESIPVAKDTQTAKGLKQVNPKHLLSWKGELKPGEQMNLSYTYQLYTRN